MGQDSRLENEVDRLWKEKKSSIQEKVPILKNRPQSSKPLTQKPIEAYGSVNQGQGRRTRPTSAQAPKIQSKSKYNSINQSVAYSGKGNAEGRLSEFKSYNLTNRYHNEQMRLLKKIDDNIQQSRHLKSSSQSLQPLERAKKHSKKAFGRIKLSYSKI